MSDKNKFVNQPLDRLMNKENIIDRLEDVEQKAGVKPSARVGALSELTQVTGNLVVLGNIKVINPSDGVADVTIDEFGVNFRNQEGEINLQDTNGGTTLVIYSDGDNWMVLENSFGGKGISMLLTDSTGGGNQIDFDPDGGIDLFQGTIRLGDVDWEKPAFSAYRSTTQAITTGTNTVVIFDSEIYDSESCYNPANGRFTPLVAGTYEFHYAAVLDALGDGKSFWIGMRKNGGTVYWGNAQIVGAAGFAGSSMTQTFYLDGVDDYIEFIVWHNHGSNRNVFNGAENTRVSGRRVSRNDIIGI